jgi:hypothetical protein
VTCSWLGDNLPVVRIFLACAALAALLLSPGLWIGPSLDAAVFSHVAERMRDGATLYVDVWDHKPPGIYVILLAGQLTLPFVSPWLVSWVLSMLSTAATAMAVALSARRVGASPPAALTAALISVIVMAQFLMALGGGLTEPLAALPMTVALAAALHPDEPTLRRTAAVGLLLAAGVLLSVQAAAGVLPVAFIVLARSSGRGRALGALALGGLAPMAAVVGWLAVTGALPAAFDAVVTYGGAYRAVAGSTGLGLTGPVMAWTLLALLFLVVPVAHGANRALRQRELPRLVGLACLAWLILGILSFPVQGRFLAHYVIPLAVPLGLLGAMGMDRLRTLWHVQRLAVLLPLAATVLISVWAGVSSGAMEWAFIARDHQRSTAVAAAVDEGSLPEEQIWVWGNEPELYLEADRPSATPYSYLYPLVTPGYASPGMIESTLAALSADPPRLIVDAGSPAPGEPGFQALLIPRLLASDGRDLDLLDPLREFVSANYRELATVDGWVIYELDDPVAGSARTGSSHSRPAATRR